MSAAPILQVEELNAGYGDLQILHDIRLVVQPGERVLVFGPNGAGKSTLMKSIVGLVAPWKGRILFQERDITGFSPEQVARLGIGYVPQLNNVFPTLSVEENLEIGGILARESTPERIDAMFRLFPILAKRRKQPAHVLSGGERQMLAMARALMTRPALLLLDEPSAGLAPILVAEIFELIAQISEKEGTAILMVEQNAKQALNIAHRAYVLEMGRNRFEGTRSDILDNENLAQVYLGRK